MRTRILGCVVAVGLLVSSYSGCTMSFEEFYEILEEARQCVPGDVCLLAGGSQCTCPTPINQSHQERVSQAAQDLDCGTLWVDCAGMENLRCEDNLCTGDPLVN